MNICIFGDSITWGAYDPEQGGWATHLRNYFEAQDNDVNIYNLGVSGDTTTDLLNRIEVEAKSREPNIVIFAIGINDAQFIHSANSQRISTDEFQNNLSKLHFMAKRFAEKFVFIGLTAVDESMTRPVPWDMDMSYTNKNIKRLDGVIEKFCKENNLEFISMNGVIKNEDLIDGLHPNTQGHKKMFDKIKPEIESLL
ncbi:MAG: gdsl-family lipolytic enzyme [Parcubacteria group bacterium GW2011_GWD2_38_12]|nr:MAG: gdsl-family lipolytic enzyme [Parcubacteria group bacterium GW2011_GWC2_36_17]KKQ43836.1 MAG: gdsl-family lipolytic enzyme [Parcubacteria group bacterium GW2011_GWE2_37_8]KKQ51734.1 MAG: gdsl-family lipolytic enzyme [Parcubacteria group bacterium GW2011_GWD2_38_12]KKQ58179.1 MAG: gdsl-family lipolytic enzyme [Parcubacteria group bacterium GW2011_GWD1_38_16]KKQ58199.1 MAG: gdsl-family lipolytic enzyme [Parcubacteria group bacterium GW2011_GWC1_38_17]